MARKDRPRLTSLAAAGALSCALAAAAAAPAPKAEALKVCVYYDTGRDGTYPNGELHAIMLENLLGHFREAAPSLSPAPGYKKGALGRCDRAAYIGSFFDAPLPADFLKDVAAYPRPFLWINYNLKALQDAQGEAAFVQARGFLFRRMRGFDPARPEGGIPGFFRDFDYKGERFVKQAAVRPQDGVLIAAPEIAVLSTTTARVLATATHSTSGETTAYAVEKGGFYYVADNPFVFPSEGDRYLILADLLFDWLGVPARGTRRAALVRLEDVHPNYDLKLLASARAILEAKKVPYAIAVIPRFVAAGKTEAEGIGFADRPAFVAALKEARAAGATLLIHGWTHNASGLEGCPPLPSGADFEFWDRCRQAPLPADSAAFAKDRVEKAKASLTAAGLPFAGWVTPHYTASAEDYRAFASAFSRSVQRVRYEAGPPGARVFVMQFFPYAVYRDHYGQAVWPEDLGFVPMPEQRAEGAEPPEKEMLANARRLRAVRDAWASFFWHPQLATRPGEPERLAALVDGLRAAGYEFVWLDALEKGGE